MLRGCFGPIESLIRKTLTTYSAFHIDISKGIQYNQYTHVPAVLRGKKKTFLLSHECYSSLYEADQTAATVRTSLSDTLPGKRIIKYSTHIFS